MNTEKLMSVVVSLLGAVVVTLMLGLTGCAGPLLLGVKEIRTSGGTEIKFITGGDFRVGANGVDTVNDNRGIQPGNGYRNGQPAKY